MSNPTTVATSADPPPASTTETVAALSVTDLTATFRTRGGVTRAVRGVTFDIRPGETFVLLGESGSGKSVTARAILRLYGGQAEIGGEVRLAGRSLLTLDARRMREIRGAELALVPQDPSGSLDPLRRVGGQLVEVLRLHKVCDSRAAAKTRALELLGLVGIPDPPRVARSFPHELSGGMRQRVVIAIAVSGRPKVIIADEPTTALDVTVQAQILGLFNELRTQLQTALLLVTHDVAVAADIADTIGVMYAGRIVEHGPADEVLRRPRHPYTRALLDALPTPTTVRGELKAIRGAPPVAGTHFTGCSFAERCDLARESCRAAEPALVLVDAGHHAACPVVNPVGTEVRS
jgi:oligopeptide/dipeptide ABC transporter ATP-binding protein